MTIEFNQFYNLFDFDPSLKELAIFSLSNLNENDYHQRFEVEDERNAQDLVSFINLCVKEVVSFRQKNTVNVINMTEKRCPYYSFWPDQTDELYEF